MPCPEATVSILKNSGREYTSQELFEIKQPTDESNKGCKNEEVRLEVLFVSADFIELRLVLEIMVMKQKVNTVYVNIF